MPIYALGTHQPDIHQDAYGNPDATVIGDECVIGHNVLMEGCTIGDRCLVGSGSIVLNRVRVGALGNGRTYASDLRLVGTGHQPASSGAAR
jgi:carbonic anhydrase/acetyltransferase-like protein (isoleucine patch superfamily)